MKTFKMKQHLVLFITLAAFFLVGCTRFSGLRKPLYDGVPVVPDEEAIAANQQSREIIGEEKAYYFRYPFSEDMYLPSLTYTDDAPVLLRTGTYTIGEDLPAGRVSLLGNESVFTSENNAVHVGNLIIRDQVEAVYFENLFHSAYGQLVAQVDFIAGHTIEIIGDDAEITAFYSERIPEEAYVLMDPPELLVNLERLEVTQPLVKDEERQTVTVTAGIYEVGVHLEPGTYEVRTVVAPHHTEMFHFKEGEEPGVYDLIQRENLLEELEEESVVSHHNNPTIELVSGDKIYPNLVHQLELVKVE